MSEQRSVAFVLSNRATSNATGWPIGSWLSELTHPFEESAPAGYEIELFSPGGALHMDDFSDPFAENGHSADDEISKAFLGDPARSKLFDQTRPLGELSTDDFDVVFLVCGRGAFWIEEEAKKVDNTTFVAGELMASHAERAGNLIAGQQLHSGAEAARPAIGVLS